MGRRVKALVPFRGRPLVAWPLAALREVADEVVVAVGTHADLDARTDILGDALAIGDAGGGPRAGLRAGARLAAGAWLLVAPCDAPLVTPALYRALLAAAREQGRDAAMPRVDGYAQPLVACYRVAPLREALAEIAAPRELAARLDAAFLDESALDALPYGRACVRDADTLEELAALEALL